MYRQCIAWIFLLLGISQPCLITASGTISIVVSPQLGGTESRYVRSGGWRLWTKELTCGRHRADDWVKAHYIYIIWDIKSVYQQFDWGFSRVPGFRQCVHDKTNWYVALCSQSLLSISLKPWWRHCHSFSSHDSSIVAFGSCSGLPRLRLASGSGASEEARCYWSHHPLWAGPRLPRSIRNQDILGYLWKYNIYHFFWSSFMLNSCSKCIMS